MWLNEGTYSILVLQHFQWKLSFSYRKFARDEVDHIIGIPEASGLSFNRGEDRVEPFKVSCGEFT